MRSSLLTLFIVSSVFVAKLSAQSSFYFSNSSAQWNLLTTEYALNTHYSTIVFQTAGDVIIGNYRYQQINDGTDQNFIRRDTTGKVFYRATTDLQDYLIYDFGKVQGDAFGFYNPWISTDSIFATVESTDTVNWGGPRKLMIVCLHFGNFDTVCHSVPLVCVDGMGALNSHFLFPGIDKAIPDLPTFNLLCYFNDTGLVYHNTNYQSCTIDLTVSGITEMVNQNAIRIAPNPVTDNIVTIQFDDNPPQATLFQLFDLTGRMVLQEPGIKKINRVAVNNLAKGMYLYFINSIDNKLQSGKLIVQ